MGRPKRWPWLAAAFLLCGVSGAAALPRAAEPAGEQPTVPPRTSRGSELHPALERVAAATSPERAAALARAAALEVRGHAVRVLVDTDSAAARAAIEARGGEVEGSYGSLVQALVPAAELASLAARADVRRIDRPATFVPAAVAGEGIAFLGADRAHAAGFDGSGVSIAIFDSSFAGYTDRQASGDLPPQVFTRGFCASGLTGGGGHGTAVAEIVHELAPAAELHLVCINTVVELGRAKDYAVELGIDVVNMSGGFYVAGDGAGSGTGPFAQLPDGIAKSARDRGVIWVNASGNEARTHWSGAFADPDADGLLDFAAGDEGNGFLVGAGQSACAFARWQAWEGSGIHSDFDLYVTGPGGAVVAASESDQRVFEPVEDACFTNAGPTQSFSAVLVHRAGDTSPPLDLFVQSAGDLEHSEPRGSLIEPAASPSVLTVGAVCRWTGALQPYSSRGRGVGPVKPDLVAPDAVSNATAGPSTGCSTGFTGTSAAAPHVTGLVALLKEQHPSHTPAQIEAFARAAARDLGRPGGDPESGYGAARLVAEAPAISGSTAFAIEGGSARGVARIASAVPGTFSWQYGPGTQYGSSTPPTSFAGSVDGIDVVDELRFVSQGTFHARLVATNAYGTTYGPDEVFVAPVGPPSVATLPAASVSAVGAVLAATASAAGSSTRVDFELGRTTAYGTPVPGTSIGLARGATVTAPSPPLLPGTTYHYRALTTNALGQVTAGRDVAFTTAPDVDVVPGAVAIGGTASVGGTLTALTGGWASLSPQSPPPALAYQWSQCRPGGGFCAPIKGAVGSAYAVRGDDAGRSLRVTVTGTVPWNSASASSPATAPVTASAPGGGAGGGGASGGASGGGGGAGSGGAASGGAPAATTPSAPAPAPAPAPAAATAAPVHVTAAAPRPAATAGRTLAGTARADVLRGTAGPDVIAGRGGADRLYGGKGRDRIDGGPGNDRIWARDGERDTIRCGPGRDRVSADARDSVARDCESVSR